MFATQKQSALRVTTRLVEVNVIVLDGHGQPVADLTRDDFSLLEEGRVQPLSVFSVEPNRPFTAQPEPLPPNTFSNCLEQRAGTPNSATVILPDGLNTRITDQVYAKTQVMKSLEQLPLQDRVALYALGRGLRVLQDFTSDPGMLLRALASHKIDLSPESEAALSEDVGAGLQQLTTWLDELKLDLIDHYDRDRALRTIRSLVAIANHVERLPGHPFCAFWCATSPPARWARSAFLSAAFCMALLPAENRSSCRAILDSGVPCTLPHCISRQIRTSGAGKDACLKTRATAGSAQLERGA